MIENHYLLIELFFYSLKFLKSFLRCLDLFIAFIINAFNLCLKLFIFFVQVFYFCSICFLFLLKLHLQSNNNFLLLSFVLLYFFEVTLYLFSELSLIFN